MPTPCGTAHEFNYPQALVMTRQLVRLVVVQEEAFTIEQTCLDPERLRHLEIRTVERARSGEGAHIAAGWVLVSLIDWPWPSFGISFRTRPRLIAISPNVPAVRHGPYNQ